MLKTVEGRQRLTAPRPSDCVARLTDTSEIAPAPIIVQHLRHRLGISPEVAALVAQLAGLGPREARHG